MTEVLFFIAGIGVVAGAVGVIGLRNPFYSVLALVVHLLSLAVLFLLLRAEFVAAAQVVVYAGAVMVLYVFVVAYVGGGVEPVGQHAGRGLRTLSVLFGAALFVELGIATLGSGLELIDTEGAAVGDTYGTPEQIGTLLLTKFLLPFEVASFLLLIAAVGAVTLARRRAETGDGPVEGYSVADLLRPRGTGTMAEAVLGLRRAQRAEGIDPDEEARDPATMPTPALSDEGAEPEHDPGEEPPSGANGPSSEDRGW